MNRSINTAVILAAGMGRRLNDVMGYQPKGFLSFGVMPIIEESIHKLIDLNINEIIIVTGHLSHFYEELAKKYREIKLIKNELYDKSGSMYSLACAKGLIKNDFLLLESDLIYEKRALEALIQFSQKDSILLSGITNSKDEVYVSKKGQETFQHLSKKKEEVTTVAGEFVGISKVSLQLYKEMLSEADKIFKTNLNIEYDTGCLSLIAKRRDIYFVKVEDLVWSEVDTGDHLVRARDIIYPDIILRDQQIQNKSGFCKAKSARRAAGLNLIEIQRFRRGNPNILLAQFCARILCARKIWDKILNSSGHTGV